MRRSARSPEGRAPGAAGLPHGGVPTSVSQGHPPKGTVQLVEFLSACQRTARGRLRVRVTLNVELAEVGILPTSLSRDSGGGRVGVAGNWNHLWWRRSGKLGCRGARETVEVAFALGTIVKARRA